jgi:hypothetical protein
MYHIKQDGKFLCGKRPVKTDNSITLSAAGRATLSMCCPVCKQEYFKMITNLSQNIDKWTTNLS